MDFVEDAVGPGMPGRLVPVPIKRFVEEDAFGGRRGVVFQGGDRVRSLGGIEPPGRIKIPGWKIGEGRGPGIQEEFMKIEPVALGGIIGSVHAEAVKLAGAYSLHPNVPDVSGAVQGGFQVKSSRGLSILGMVK
jgi:hypothetical protein